MKLSLETRNRGDVIIVHCQGRIVYRDEAAALSRVVGEVLQQAQQAGARPERGELDGQRRHRRAGPAANLGQGQNVNLKCAGANPLVRTLLDLTNLDSVLEVHPSVDAALESFREEQVCADC